MGSKIDVFVAILETFSERIGRGDKLVDRPEIVAHASLSALTHHWPSRATASLRALLAATQVIRDREPGRWMTQRRLAIARLSRAGA